MASIKRRDILAEQVYVEVEYDDVDGDGWRIKKVAADNKGTQTIRISFLLPIILNFIVLPGNKLAYSCATGEKTKVTTKTDSKSPSVKIDIEQLGGIEWKATYGI